MYRILTEMLYPFQIFLDFIFPPTIHELALRQVTKERFVSFLQPLTKDAVVYLTPYHLPLIQAAIAACKFEHNYHAAKLLGSLVEKHLKTLPLKKTLIIPLPLSRIRERERGFNQVERVLLYVGTNELPYLTTINTHMLTRTRHTKAQTSLSRKERLKNIQNAFACAEKNIPMLAGYERIIVCDDVYTTGSTFKAAREALSPHIPSTTELYLLAWAH